MLKNDEVYLRALEPTDLDFLYQLENNTNLWHVSGTQTPYSKYVLKQYLQNATQSIYEAQQLRLAICTPNHTLVGLVDLFDFCPKNNRAGIGVVIANEKDKQKGYAKNALQLLINYCFTHLQMHQLYANIECDNVPSINLFTALQFKLVGVKKQWNKRGNLYIDEALYQLINE